MRHGFLRDECVGTAGRNARKNDERPPFGEVASAWPTIGGREKSGDFSGAHEVARLLISMRANGGKSVSR